MTVVLAGHVSNTVAGAVTVKLALHVDSVGVHELVYVNVTVVDPPQIGGAPVLVFVND